MTVTAERDESMKQQRRIQLGAGAKLVLVMGELLLFLLLAQSVSLKIQTDRAFASVPRALPVSITVGQENSAAVGIVPEESAGRMEAQAELLRQEKLAGIFRISGTVLLIFLFQLSLTKILHGVPPTRIPYI